MKNAPHPEWIIPEWPVAPSVRALMTTRAGGVSSGAFESLNLGERAGDDPRNVARNRAILRACLPREPVWLRQVHGAVAIDAARALPDAEADGAVARTAGTVCSVLTADCLPVLLADRDGEAVGIAHAGWRGLARGIVGNVVRMMGVPVERIVAYIGPGIGSRSYEVGDDVHSAFVDADPGAERNFAALPNGRYLADLYGLARRRLEAAGVEEVYGGDFCTASEKRFFSYRRDGITGRMAALVWLERD